MVLISIDCLWFWCCGLLLSGQPAAAAGGAARGFLILIFEMVTTPQHHRYRQKLFEYITIYYVAVGRGHKYHSKEVAVKRVFPALLFSFKLVMFVGCPSVVDRGNDFNELSVRTYR